VKEDLVDLYAHGLLNLWQVAGKTVIHCHSRGSGSPDGEKTGFLLPGMTFYEQKAFFSKLLGMDLQNRVRRKNYEKASGADGDGFLARSARPK